MHQQGSAAVSHSLVLTNAQNTGIGVMMLMGPFGFIYPQGTVKAEAEGLSLGKT